MWRFKIANNSTMSDILVCIALSQWIIVSKFIADWLAFEKGLKARKKMNNKGFWKYALKYSIF